MHFKKIIISLSATAASLALAAPAAAPAPASALAARADSPNVYHGTNSYDWYVPCTYDFAHYDLKYNSVSFCKSPDEDGRVKCTFHFNQQGTATAYDGTKYQIVTVQNQKYDYEIYPPYEYEYTFNLRLRTTKQGSGLVWTGNELVTVSYDVDDGYKVDVKRIKYECV